MQEPITINKYLSEEWDTIYSICSDAIENKRKIHFKAPVGSGKTTAIIELIDNYPSKQIIVLFPQISISEQVHQKLTTKGIDACIVNSRTITSVINKYADVTGGVFLTTIDSAYKLIDGLEMTSENTFVIIDETHSLMQSARPSFTRSIQTMLDNGFPVIGFSATPSSWVNNLLIDTDEEIEVEFAEEYTQRVAQTTIENGLERTVANEIVEGHRKLTVVFMEEKIKQNKLKENLLKYEPTLNVCCFNSDTKASESKDEWDYLMQHDKLSGDCDVYIINSVAQAGVNITNPDIDKVYLVDYFDPFGFAQYLGRCRNYGKEYQYYNAPYPKQMEIANGDKIEDAIKDIQILLDCTDDEMKQFILRRFPYFEDYIYQDAELNLLPNKCTIANDVYKNLRQLRGSDLIRATEALFPHIEFEVTPSISGIVTTSKDSMRKKRKQAKDDLKAIIISDSQLIDLLARDMNYDYSMGNMKSTITKLSDLTLKFLGMSKATLWEIVRLLPIAQFSPERLVSINTLYSKSGMDKNVLDEIFNLSKNRFANINGAIKFFGTTNSSEINKLMADMYYWCNELATATEWKDLLQEKIKAPFVPNKLVNDLYKYCMQTKRSTNGQLKLLKVNETIEDYLETFDFKHLAYSNGQLTFKDK